MYNTDKMMMVHNIFYSQLLVPIVMFGGRLQFDNLMLDMIGDGRMISEG